MKANNGFQKVRELYDFIDDVKSTYSSLGENEFFDWMGSLDESTQSMIHDVLSEPAFNLRDKQRLPLGDWRTLFFRTGRGWGKTNACAHAVDMFANYWYPGETGILVGATVKDVRDTMIEGDSGILNQTPEYRRPKYNKHDNTLVWLNGSKAIIRTADNPEDIRGPSIVWGWADEMVKWRDERSYDNFRRCVRNRHALGARIILSTTPDRAKQWIKAIEDSTGCFVVTGAGYENDALDPSVLAEMRREAAVGSLRSRQEIMGEWVDADGNLWTQKDLDAARLPVSVSLAEMLKSCGSRLISVDPAGDGKGDETGIMLFGQRGEDIILFRDESTIENIEIYTSRILDLFEQHCQAGDTILIESNFNKSCKNLLELKANMRGLTPRIATVDQYRSKYQRAEECFVHWQSGNIKLYGVFPKLEQQLMEWEPVMAKSPDRGDAFTQGVNYLAGTNGRGNIDSVFTVGNIRF